MKLVLFASIFCVLSTIQQSNAQSKYALLLVGHQEDGTTSAIHEMNKIADLFQANGIGVYKFYDYNANWEEVKRVASECSFLVYSGHGSNLGIQGQVGGLIINPSVSTEKLMSELRLKNNSLILFKSVCYGAGSTAGDDEDIQVEEAKRRVTEYAYPFFEIGAAAYYANNYQNGVYNFLTDFFKGKTIKDAFVNSASTWTDIEFDVPFSRYTNKNISIASSAGGGMATRITYTNGVKKVETVPSPKSYSIAYVGDPNFSINDQR